MKDWLTVSVSSLSVMLIVLSPKDGKFISFEVFFIVFYYKCRDFSIQTGTEIDADVIFTLKKSLKRISCLNKVIQS